MKTTIITAIATLALIGCTKVGAPDATTAEFTAKFTAEFMCDRNDPISVSFYDDKAMLNFAGGSAKLDQELSGSGYRYAGQGHEIRGKGMELIWTKPDGATRSCREEESAIPQP
ncbi:MAG: MliC family protein [Sphingomonadaceae bacterium]|jgi:membrane-bound inhibitor of C-type lysozyme